MRVDVKCVVRIESIKYLSKSPSTHVISRASWLAYSVTRSFAHTHTHSAPILWDPIRLSSSHQHIHTFIHNYALIHARARAHTHYHSLLECIDKWNWIILNLRFLRLWSYHISCIDDVISRAYLSPQVFDLAEKKIGWGPVNKETCGSIWWVHQYYVEKISITSVEQSLWLWKRLTDENYFMRVGSTTICKHIHLCHRIVSWSHE